MPTVNPRFWRGVGVGLLLALPFWFFLAAALAAQATGPYQRTFKVADTAMTEFGNIDSIQKVRPRPPQPDTPPVVTPPPPGQRGIGFGCSGCLDSDLPVTLSQDSYTPGNTVEKLAQARARNVRVVMNVMGGSHSNFKTNGRWDPTKAKGRLDSMRTPAIKVAMARAISEGRIVGVSVMDEPQQCGSDEKAWGPCQGSGAYLTKAIIDGLCRDWKAAFPGLIVGVVHDWSKLDPGTYYKYCDFIGSQWRQSKGEIGKYARDAVAWARKSGVSYFAMLNYIHGGAASASCVQYGEEAAGSTLCPMTPDQIGTATTTVIAAGACAVGGFRYEEEYHTKPEVRAAMKASAVALAAKPGRGCGRTA